MGETWKRIEGFGGYSVSSYGSIKRRGRRLKAWIAASGYKTVRLYKNGQRKDWLVHRLVVAAFLEPLKIGYEINHKDGNKLNNRPSNLEQVTRQENIQHAFRIGLKEKTTKLTEQSVKEIRAERETGRKVLATRYGVTRSVITRVLNGERWSHVK